MTFCWVKLRRREPQGNVAVDAGRARREPANNNSVMPGLVPGIHAFLTLQKTWMAGT
jgi:hypothetical protein